MRLFFIALALFSLATFSYGQESETKSGDSGWQPMRSPRFETSAAQDYLMRRARADREHRTAMLRYYDSIGFTYGSPVVNGGTYYNLQSPNRYRRFYSINSAFSPVPYGM